MDIKNLAARGERWFFASSISPATVALALAITFTVNLVAQLTTWPLWAADITVLGPLAVLIVLSRLLRRKVS